VRNYCGWILSGQIVVRAIMLKLENQLVIGHEMRKGPGLGFMGAPVT